MKSKVKIIVISAIHSLDRLILNDYLISIVKYSKKYEEDYEELLELKDFFPKKADVGKIFSFYEKFLENKEKMENKEKLESEDNYKNIDKVIFNFDIFGDRKFIEKLGELSKNTINKEFFEIFIEELKYHTFVNIKDKDDLLKKLNSIYELRQSLIHGNKRKYTQYDILESAKTLFLFLPNVKINEIIQVLNYKRLKNLQKWSSEENRKTIESLNRNISKDILFFNIKNKPNTESIIKYKDFVYMKLCCFIGYFSIIRIKSILNIKKYKNDIFYKNLNNDLKHITIEEIYKIYDLLLNINSLMEYYILKPYYEDLNFNNKDIIKNLRNNIFHSNIFYFYDNFSDSLQVILNFLNNIISEQQDKKIKKEFIKSKFDFMVAMYRLLCKKDYLILVITKDKNKKTERQEIQKISYKNEINDTKQSLREDYINKIKSILEKEKEIKVDNFDKKNLNFFVRKYYLYYSLKRSLIEQFLEIKNIDKKKFKKN